MPTRLPAGGGRYDRGRMVVFWTAFYVFSPALVLYLCHKHVFLKKLGAVVICYIVGMVVGNTGILPDNITTTQTLMTTLTIPLALPLIFFSIDIRRWRRLAGKSILSFALAAVGTVIAAGAGFSVFRAGVGEESWKVGGMLIGVYTGGTPNLAAIGNALQVDPTAYVAAHTADVVVSAIYLLLLLTVVRKILLMVLPRFQSTGEADLCDAVEDFVSYGGILERQKLLPLLKALGLALVISAVAAGLAFVFPQDIGKVVAVLTVCTLGVVCSLIPAIRAIPMTFQLGQYIILIFCLAVSSMADLSKLVSTAPAMVGYVTVVIFVGLAIHAALAAMFGIDADTVIITSVAGVFSPPFVPMVAAVLRNKEVVVTGVVTGVIGWVIGTYLGVIVGYLLKMFS